MRNFKFVLIASAILAFGLLSMSFEDQGRYVKDLGRVQKIEGKYVFVMCEPVEQYTEVGKVNTLLTAMTGNEWEFEPIARKMVKKGLKKEQANELKFDAVIMQNGTKGILIKYKK